MNHMAAAPSPSAAELQAQVWELRTLVFQKVWAFERLLAAYRQERNQMWECVTDEKGNYDTESDRTLIVEMDRTIDCAAREIGALIERANA